MINVKNNQTGEVKNLDDDSKLPDLVQSGAISIPDKEYDFQTPEGEKYKVGAAGFLDAVKQGWKYRDQGLIKDENLEAKYGDQTAKALLYSGARGLTLGASDYLLPKTGLVSKEELSEVSKRNEAASITGEVAATIIPTFFSGGSNLVAKVASKSLPGLIAKASTRAGSRAAQNITSKIANGVISIGVEGAVEGAAMGLSQTVSEAALGDAEFNAESLLSNVGTGALAGGVFGAAIGAASHYITSASKAVQKKVLDKVISQVDGDDALKATVRARLSDEGKMEDGLLALKDPEIQKIKELYPDAPVTPGMESALKPVKNVENYLFDAPTLQGEAIRKSSNEIKEYVEKNVDQIWSGAREASPEEAGDLIRQTLFTNVNEPLESGRAFYADMMDEFGNAPVNDRHRTALSNIIKDSDAYRIGSEGVEIKRVLGIIDDKKVLLSQHADELAELGLNKRQISELHKNGVTAKMNDELNEMGVNLKKFNDTLSRHADELPKKNLTLKQIKELQSDIGAKLKMTTGSERKLLRETYDKLRTMQDSIIKETVGNGKSAQKIIEGLDAANANYVRAYKAKDEIADAFGVKGSDFDTVLEKLEKMSAVDLDKRFMNVKKSDKAMEMLEKYPDLGKLVLANRQSKLLKKHQLTDGSFNFAGLKKDLLKMDPEERAIYFGGSKPREQRLIDMLTLYEKRPKTLNPSGTDIRKELREMISPKAIVGNWTLGEVYKGNKSYLGNLFNKVLPNLAGIEKSSNKTKNKVATSVSHFFKSVRPGVDVGTIELLSEKKLDKAQQTYEDIQVNPEIVLNNYMKNNKDLLLAAPETYASLQTKIVAGIQFLQSKTLKQPDDYMVDNRKPSRSELIKFNDYVQAVEKPQVIYDQISQGYINPRTVETLKVVYPKIYQSIVAEVNAKKPKNISRTQAIELQKLLGSKVTPSMDYDKFQILQGKTKESQAANMQANSEMTNNGKYSATGAREINSSGRAQSSFDKVVNRS